MMEPRDSLTLVTIFLILVLLPGLNGGGIGLDLFFSGDKFIDKMSGMNN
jgi:hypothetical protein